MMKLYSARVCPFAHRTRLALRQKGATYETVEIDLKAMPDWYRQISPNQKVPLVEHDGRKIWESAIINEYVEEALTGPALWPSDPYLKAQGRIWLDYFGSQVIPPFYALLKSQDRSEHPAQREKLLSALNGWVEGLDPQGPFGLGNQASLLDLGCYPWFERWPILEHYRGESLPTTPRLQKWLQAVRELDSVRQEVNPSDFYIDLYKAYAIEVAPR